MPARSLRRRPRRQPCIKRAATIRSDWANSFSCRPERRGGLHRLQHRRAALRSTLMDGFVKSWGNEPTARLGDCWMRAVCYYYDREHLATIKPDADWYPPSIFFQAMKYMFYGDPSLKLPH